jgi:catechol 2,3-dioxygenase-like lactoylglutathione lyase family enzyme
MTHPVTIHRVQHVSVPRPPGSQAATRRFYGEVLGLEEAPVPEALTHLDLVWYRLGDTELHLYAGPPAPEGYSAHFCIKVDDVQKMREHLTRHDVAIRDDVAIPNRPRFFIRDPFGNRIEITSIQGPYR